MRYIETEICEREAQIDRLRFVIQELKKLRSDANSQEIVDCIDQAETKSWDLMSTLHPSHTAPLDPLVEKFLTDASADSSPDELDKMLQPLLQLVSVPLIGPLWGTIMGLARLRKVSPDVANAFCLGVSTLIDRPGYNDFLMSQWKICKAPDLIPAMLARLDYPDELVASTASWMIGSVAVTDPEFDLALHDAGYKVGFQLDAHGDPKLVNNRAQYTIVPLAEIIQ